MEHFEGERIFSQSPQELWPKFRDVSFLARCVPGGAIHDGATSDRAVCTVHPGFSFMRGSLEVTMLVIEHQTPTTVKFALKSKGIGSSSEVETALALAAHDQGTKIRWTADVKTLGGLLKMIPAGLIRGAAHKVIDDIWASLAEKLRAAV